MLEPLSRMNLDEAYDLLCDCNAIVVNGIYIMIPKLNELTEEDENVFMALSWSVKGLTYELYFREGNNIEIPIQNTKMFLLDDKSEDDKDFTEVSLLFEMNLEE